jgi:hypothetical protein
MHRPVWQLDRAFLACSSSTVAAAYAVSNAGMCPHLHPRQCSIAGSKHHLMLSGSIASRNGRERRQNTKCISTDTKVTCSTAWCARGTTRAHCSSAAQEAAQGAQWQRGPLQQHCQVVTPRHRAQVLCISSVGCGGTGYLNNMRLGLAIAPAAAQLPHSMSLSDAAWQCISGPLWLASQLCLSLQRLKTACWGCG